MGGIIKVKNMSLDLKSEKLTLGSVFILGYLIGSKKDDLHFFFLHMIIYFSMEKEKVKEISFEGIIKRHLE